MQVYPGRLGCRGVSTHGSSNLGPGATTAYACPEQYLGAKVYRYGGILGPMLELAILGFLAERPLHGYDLKRRVAHLTGHVRPIADGTLYPAIKRLERAGLLTRGRNPARAPRPGRRSC